MPDSPVKLPAGYAPAFAIGYADPGGNLVLAAADAPLPVSISGQGPGQSAPTPFEGTAIASSMVGPYEPIPGEAIILQLDGNWSGTVQLLRSPATGAPAVPVTIGGLPWAAFSNNACEPVWEESEAGAELFLEITLSSGSVNYRVSQ